MTLTKIEPQNLRTPGPTPIPDDIMDEMSLPMINHRGPEFKELIEATTAGLKQVFMTANDLYILTSSGTGALEAAVVNTLSPGDKVIAATAGSFGDRFVEIAAGYGADVVRMDFEWGDAIDPERVVDVVALDPWHHGDVLHLVEARAKARQRHQPQQQDKQRRDHRHAPHHLGGGAKVAHRQNDDAGKDRQPDQKGEHRLGYLLASHGRRIASEMIITKA